MQVVFKSPVQSGLLNPRDKDQDRNWLTIKGSSQKTGQDRLKPVFCGPKTSYNQSSIIFGRDRSQTGFSTKVYQ